MMIDAGSIPLWIRMAWKWGAVNSGSLLIMDYSYGSWVSCKPIHFETHGNLFAGRVQTISPKVIHTWIWVKALPIESLPLQWWSSRGQSDWWQCWTMEWQFCSEEEVFLDLDQALCNADKHHKSWDMEFCDSFMEIAAPEEASNRVTNPWWSSMSS